MEENIFPRIVICGDRQLKARQGIHLSQPCMRGIENAFEDAAKDGFEVIYCHYPMGKDSSRLDIEQNMLAAFFRLSQRDGVVVDVADVAD